MRTVDRLLRRAARHRRRRPLCAWCGRRIDPARRATFVLATGGRHAHAPGYGCQARRP